MKIKKVIYPDGTTHHLYNCPGCGYEHAFSPVVHQFNGDVNNPTISPSLLNTNPQKYRVCHSFVENGAIRFLNDCWHKLAGQTVDLPHYPEGTKDLDYSNRNENDKD